MKNYAQVLKKFAKILHQNNWPQTLWITSGMYWDVIIASDGEILPDWRFHPTGEDEGFPFFLIGPTMVRPQKGCNSVALTHFTSTREEKFIEASNAMIDEGGPVDAGIESIILGGKEVNVERIESEKTS